MSTLRPFWDRHRRLALLVLYLAFPFYLVVGAGRGAIDGASDWYSEWLEVKWTMLKDNKPARTHEQETR